MNFGSNEYKEICADHQAICKYAGFQPFPEIVRDHGFIFYLESKVDGERIVGLVLTKGVVSEDSAIYTKDEVLTALKKEMESTFPEFVIETSVHDIAKNRAANKVAQQTRRGAANTQFLDFFYYKGSNATDCPFIVYKFGDKYGIFKHPNAEQYGFSLIYK